MPESVILKTENDGVEALLNKVEADLEEGLLPIDIFNDEEIFKAEMERIFGAS